jgi:hypothetical protein
MPLPNNARTPVKTAAKTDVSAQETAIRMIKSVTALIDELALLMDKEASLVEKRKLVEHAELLKQKQRLTIDYRASLKAIALQPDILKLVPADIREKAKVAAQKLADGTDRNARMLRGAILATQRLVQTIVGIVKDEVVPKGGYIHSGILQQAQGCYSPTCKPITGSRTA